VRRDPRCLGVLRSRWRLADLLGRCEWLNLTRASSLGQLLRRLGISYQRGRSYVHSPDERYGEKLAFRDQVLAQARATPAAVVTLFADEVTYYRPPSLARAWEARRGHGPRAHWGLGPKTTTRVAATLEATTGRVVFWQGAAVGVRQLVAFYQQLCTAYPQAERLYLVEDNWPVHFHPDVLVALEPQLCPCVAEVKTRWGTEPTRAARRRWGDWQLPIQLVPLPTYASWLNPIEKLWRWLKQDVLHLHPFGDRLSDLREQVVQFLSGFQNGSQALLRYVGLLSHA